MLCSYAKSRVPERAYALLQPAEDSRVEDARGKVINPKISIGEHGFVSVCMDTEGNLFGLSSMQ